jgi:uncharacterized membrane protein
MTTDALERKLNSLILEVKQVKEELDNIKMKLEEVEEITEEEKNEILEAMKEESVSFEEALKEWGL